MTKLMNAFRSWPRQGPTLRFRLLLWFLVVLVATSVALILLVNTMAAALIPSTINIIPIYGADTQSPTAPAISVPREDIPAIVARTLDEVRTISLVALGLTILVGGVGAYLLTGVALRPVSRLSREIVGIDSDKLSQRLLWQGPADEVKQLADAFDKVLEQLERAFTRQGRFAADAAHELRTPLAILRTNLEVVHSDPAATLADYRDMTTTQERILTRLEQLVSDLLLLTREEQDRNFGEVYLLPLLEEVVADMTPLAQERGVELRLMAESELATRGDEVLLRPIFRNLVDNGIRYNRPGGRVFVNVKVELKWAVIQISDTGIGIPVEEQSRILDRFYRPQASRSRQNGGAGLGLSIVSHLVYLHGGHLEIESTPGVGSTFTVWLPKLNTDFTGSMLD
jgi:signal transduction histidine kinase